jgi:hypothetical protein
MLGSDACQKDPSEIQGTIRADTLQFRELERVSQEEFVVVSGRMIYPRKVAPNETPLPIYALFRAGSHCSGIAAGKTQDVFVVEINYLARVR